MSVDTRRAFRRMRRLTTMVAAGGLVLACSSTSASSTAPSSAPAAGGVSVDATLTEFKIDLSASTAAAGSVTFHVKNGGTTAHEFVVFRTDLAPDKLPVESDEPEVDEKGPGLTSVDEVEDVAPGTSKDLTVELTPGKYVFICNLPAHYSSGMHVAFTVGS